MHTKRTVTAEAPRDVHAWRVQNADLATRLWGRANRLRNLLNAAETRDEAMKHAIAYLRAQWPLVEESGSTHNVGEVAIRWLATCTTDRFAAEAIRHVRQLEA